MAPTTSVTVSGMQAAQGNFQNALDQMNTSYNQMDEQRSTLAANWTGESSSLFGQALGTWLDDLNAVRTQLNNVLTQLETNTGIYNRTNDMQNQTASSFAKGLPGLNNL